MIALKIVIINHIEDVVELDIFPLGSYPRNVNLIILIMMLVLGNI